MQRRVWLQLLAGFPALAQNQEIPNLAETAPEAAGVGVRTFFNAQQTAALRKLASLIAPKTAERPGAVEAGVVEFLDFLIRSSDGKRQSLYRNGLDRLNAEARKRGPNSFADAKDEQTNAILKPLQAKWTYQPPADPFARFLREAKDDILLAANNSRVYAEAGSRRSRAASGLNLYWLPLD